MTKILVIEDEEALLATIQQMLEFEAFDVLTAPNGVVGVALAREHLPDIIVCDIMMPELDGYGVLHALREDPATRTIPFIFLTAKSEREHLRQGMTLGASDYITKPFSRREFLAAIDTRLTHQRTVQAQHESELEALRQAIVYALPQELNDLLTGVLDHTAHLIAHAGTLTPSDVYQTARHIFESSGTLHRQIENYLLYAQLEILRMAPDRVLIQRSYQLTAPSAAVYHAAQTVARRRARPDDLTLALHDERVRITQENLRKVVEELLDHVFANSTPGSPVDITTRTEGDFFVVQITHPEVTLADSLIAALEHRVQAGPQWQTPVAGPALGIVIARRLLEVYGGRLEWHSTPAQGLQWRAVLKRDQDGDS